VPLTFELLCSFGKDTQLFNCPETVVAVQPNCFLALLNMMSLLLHTVALDAEYVPPKSNPVPLLGVWKVSHCHCIYLDEVDKRTVLLYIYGLLLGEQILDLHRIER
jgi:hypothetical protein